MPTSIPTADLNKILSQPGMLGFGVLGSADPANTVVGSVFTDDFFATTGWAAAGPTDAGSQFHDSVSTEPFEIAESYYDVSTIVVGREASIDFALAHFTATNIKKALNGATSATGGSGTTLLTTITPPVIGSEVRVMVGWESTDHTVRLVGYQAFQIGSIEPEFRKGATKALLTCTFKLEQSSAGYPWRMFLAGASRGA